MTNPNDTRFAIETMNQKLVGAVITKILQSDPDPEGNIHYGFEAVKDNKVIRAWVPSDPEGNGAGYLDICI